MHRSGTAPALKTQKNSSHCVVSARLLHHVPKIIRLPCVEPRRKRWRNTGGFARDDGRHSMVTAVSGAGGFEAGRYEAR
jgi:hypothetical protein